MQKEKKLVKFADDLKRVSDLCTPAAKPLHSKPADDVVDALHVSSAKKPATKKTIMKKPELRGAMSKTSAKNKKRSRPTEKKKKVSDSSTSKSNEADLRKYQPPLTLTNNWPSTGSQPRLPFAFNIPRKGRRSVLNKGESINTAFFTGKNQGRQISFYELNQKNHCSAVAAHVKDIAVRQSALVEDGSQ